MNILEGLKNISEEHWEKYEKELDVLYPNLTFENILRKFNLSQMLSGIYETNHWIVEFNNKLFNIDTNYIQMMAYYFQDDKGDFSEYDNQKLVDQYWYGYYAESLTQRIIGAYDILIHIINAKYQFNKEPNPRFNMEVMTYLKSENLNLYNDLKSTLDNANYININTLRNDFTHNNNPINLTHGIKRSGDKVTFSKGEKKSNDEILKSIHEGITLLQQTKVRVEKEIFATT